MKLNISNTQKALPLSKASIKKVTEALCVFLSISCEELSVYFVTDKKISELHAQFFDDPTPTDCITFPIDDTYLGDIFICPEAALRYAAKRKADPYRETLLYLVHGLLHLLGYDDIKPAARRTMREIEKKCMGHLSKLDLKLTEK